MPAATSVSRPPAACARFAGRAWLGYAGAAVPVALYIWFFGRYAVNVPKWDDHALKGFLQQTTDATNVAEWLGALWRQHNEHRIVYTRLITWLDATVFGYVNFTHLMAVGNVALLALLLLFGNVLKRAGGTVYYVAPVAFALFSTSQWENTLWGMAALQNFTVAVWVLGAFYALAIKNRFGWAVTLAVAATLTSGNGLLVWPIGAVLLFVKDGFTPKNRGRILGWLGAAALTVALYFWQFAAPADKPPVSLNVLNLVWGGLMFLGSAAADVPLAKPALMAGLLGGALLLGVVIWAWSAYRNRTLRSGAGLWLAATLLFWLGTGAVVAWSRMNYGLEMMLASRYKLYSLGLLATLVVAFAIEENRRSRYVAVVLSLTSIGLFWLSLRPSVEEATALRRGLLTQQFNWTYPTLRPQPKLDVVSQRWTRPAGAFYDKAIATLLQPATGPTLRPDTVLSLTNATFLSVPNPDKLGQPTLWSALPDDGRYVRLWSDKRSYLFPMQSARTTGLRVALGLNSRYAPRAEATLPHYEVQTDRYVVDVLTVTNGRVTVQPTGRTLDIITTNPPKASANW